MCMYFRRLKCLHQKWWAIEKAKSYLQITTNQLNALGKVYTLGGLFPHLLSGVGYILAKHLMGLLLIPREKMKEVILRTIYPAPRSLELRTPYNKSYGPSCMVRLVFQT